MSTHTTLARYTLFLVAGLLLAALSACNNDPTDLDEDDHRFRTSLANIEGTVFFRERIDLPRKATLEVQLLDLTNPDNPALLISSGPINISGRRPPYAFQIPINLAKAKVDKVADRLFALRATIHSDDKLMFSNKNLVAVTDGSAQTILVTKIALPEDSGAFTLQETHWGLVTLGGSIAAHGAGDRQLDLRLIGAETRIAGFSGCNRYSATYTLNTDDGETSLAIGPIAGTRMACPQGRGDIETQFLAMLASVTSFQREDDVLTLLAGEQVVATFKPI